MVRPRWACAVALAVGLMWLAQALALPTVALAKVGQIPVVDGGKFAGLKWTFVRIKYGSSDDEGGPASRLSYWDEPWAIDAPAAEQNLTRRIKSMIV